MQGVIETTQPKMTPHTRDSRIFSTVLPFPKPYLSYSKGHCGIFTTEAQRSQRKHGEEMDFIFPLNRNEGHPLDENTIRFLQVRYNKLRFLQRLLKFAGCEESISWMIENWPD